MNTPEIESRLKNTAAIAAGSRSIVDDVMEKIGSSLPEPARPRWRRPIVAAGIAALSGIAAIFAFVFYLTGAAPLTLADVQNAFEQQRWVHTLYDVGQITESWTNLQTGEWFDSGANHIVYLNDQTNTRLWYWKNSGVIYQDAPTKYGPGINPPKWDAQTAWSQFVAPLADASTQPAAAQSPRLVAANDSLNGIAVVRFDKYGTDEVGKRFLYSQLWADPHTHLPVRVKTRLQLAEREMYGKEYSTGDFDFPPTGPADLYALGVPRDTPIHKELVVAPTGVQALLDNINHACDHFLKNYRAIVWTPGPIPAWPVDSLDIIWRDGDKVRADHHLPPLEMQTQPEPRLTERTPEAILAWASHHEPIEKDLMDTLHEYSWTAAPPSGNSLPQLHVFRHERFPLLSTGSWPENIQWPTRYFGPDYQILGTNSETPAGCLGLRKWSGGNNREDYYVDPANDYVCIKYTQWILRGAKWMKNREEIISNLSRIDGCVVAGTQRIETFEDPASKLSGNVVIATIILTPLTPAQYPPGTFAAGTLTKGAKVEGY